MITQIDMQTIAERIKLLLEHFKMSQSEFADFVDVSRQNISNALNGVEPKATNLLKIKNATGISSDWLFEGKGNMFAENSANTFANVSEPSAPYLITARHPVKLSDQDFISLPLLDARVMASFSDNIYGAMYKLDTGKTYTVLQMPNRNYDKAMVMEVVGDSMLPNFRNGMKVIVREVPKGRWDTATGIHAISVKGGMFTLKRIVSNKHNLLTLRADNPQFPEELTVQLADVMILFRVGEVVYAPPVQDIE